MRRRGRGSRSSSSIVPCGAIAHIGAIYEVRPPWLEVRTTEPHEDGHPHPSGLAQMGDDRAEMFPRDRGVGDSRLMGPCPGSSG